MASIKQVADELAPRIGPLAESLTNTSEAAHAALDTIDRHVGPLAESVKSTSEAAHVALNDIDQLAVAGKHQLATSGEQLDRVLASADRTVRAADTLVGSLTEMMATDSPLREDLRASIRDLAATASAMRGFSHEIERDPSLVLTGRPGH